MQQGQKQLHRIRSAALCSLLSFALLCAALFSPPRAASAQLLVTNTPFLQPTSTPIPVDVIDVPLLGREVQAGQAFQMIGLEVEKTANTLNRVSVRVQNVFTSTRSGYIWYLLAPPGIDEPWTQAVYFAPEQAVELAPGEAITLDFPAPDIPLQGEYGLSVWSHQVEPDGTRIHADGVVYESPLVIGAPFFVRVDYVDVLPQTDGTMLLFVTFTFFNTTSAPVEIGYSYSVAAPDDPTPWETGAYNLPFQPLILPPQSRQTLSARRAVALEAGNYQVIGWLHERVEGELAFRSSYTFPALVQMGS